jgi:hypothetical protein
VGPVGELVGRELACLGDLPRMVRMPDRVVVAELRMLLAQVVVEFGVPREAQLALRALVDRMVDSPPAALNGSAAVGPLRHAKQVRGRDSRTCFRPCPSGTFGSARNVDLPLH